MIDKKKVIKGLEQFKADFKPFCGNGSDWARVDDAINLLKEQPKIVRCQDCKNGEPGACGYGIDCDGVWHDDDWFCADGERKDNDA